MNKRTFLSLLKFYLSYILYWLSLFWAMKIIFLVFHLSLTAGLTFSEIAGIFVHGFSMDLSTAFIVLAIPTLLIVLSVFFRWEYLRHILNGYTLILIIAITFLFIIDLELYHYWNFRIDRTILKYLDATEVMTASVSTFVIVRQIVLGLVLSFTAWYLYRKFISRRLIPHGRMPLFTAPVFLFLLAASIIPIRGGLGVAIMNSGFAYFSSNSFVNHAALNMPFHFGESLAHSIPENNPYHDFDPDELMAVEKRLFPDSPEAGPSLLKTSRPNIILIILESFTAKVVEPLGGLKGITPNLNALADSGILFQNFYASGDRTDKALPAILSGFQALPNLSITKFSAKAEQLPVITHVLKEAGYTSTFIYGGTLNFAGIRAYLNHGDFNKINDIEYFPASERTTKWGVHDGPVFESFKKELSESDTPFFKVLLTLSSHEPFDVPMKPVFAGNDEETLFLNSLYYTDSIVGTFTKWAEKQSWWDHTLIILLADHSVRLPGGSPNEHPDKFHIPMIWTGGAIARDTIISVTGSQTDLIPTLLAQMNLPAEQFQCGRNLLAPHVPSFAYYAFNNGFGLVTDTAIVAMDNISDIILYSKGNINDSIIRIGKACRQMSFKLFE